MIISMFRGVGVDLESWISTIFIHHSTEDIHYFDASFANNCFEIESLLQQKEIESSDDDLEFF